MSDEPVIEKLDTKKLDKIIKALKKGKLTNVKIGIFGANTRPDGTSNASIGAIHEFGTDSIPQRSFLRTPIQDNLEKELEASGAFDKDTLNRVVTEGDMLAWFKKIAATAEKIVAEGFATNGFGKWAGWSKGYTSKSGNILNDTGQLRDSITTVIK